MTTVVTTTAAMFMTIIISSIDALFRKLGTSRELAEGEVNDFRKRGLQAPAEVLRIAKAGKTDGISMR